ncbi:hypothetical protein ACBR40_34095 [Nonomuraea sp. AD125B]|uniref:hypothetical protein n=1 Tax=Nonomuraea TaxID=83681 RepID=UPI0031E2C2E9
MRSLKTLVVAILTTIGILAVPALAQAAPAGPALRGAAAQSTFGHTAASVETVALTAAVQGKPNPCKRFKSNLKKWLICQGIMKAGGMWLWNQLEKIAKKGWNHFRNHPTVKRYVGKHARGLYCMLTLKC